ncbi:acyl-CoA thioesterase-1 [Ferrimonas sediminum]|uniref:Acyl-CoA thioesterase-1 n=1 Tax=Ferrimonas sediminum TaxID=718193 RepID=A0A1G8YPF4_9GAMM|nr:arylesterase [Ferrimonas sediminum]SDK04617.1 acyl-CoA thioesterase-1 [Ferrimonas sediminum]
MTFRSLFIVFILLFPSIGRANSVTILILGDSLSASYGMDELDGWVHKMNTEQDDFRLINASVSGETSGGALRRLPGLLNEHRPDWVFVELGGNDGLRGFPTPMLKDNLGKIIDASILAGSAVMLSEVMVPPNYGPRYASMFSRVYRDLSSEYDVPLIPFFMTEIAPKPELMQRDGIHPNRAAQEGIVDFLRPYFETHTLP